MANAYDEESGLAAYQSSLNDLNMNSKPMINVLTMLAEENEANAKGIVRMIRTRIISKEDIKSKMPSLYLLDSILKNVGGDYIKIISQHMVEIFTNVFQKGDERIRMSMFKLRNTWPQYFPSKFLHELDMSVRGLDPNWPVTELPVAASSIHINPKFLLKHDEVKPANNDDSVLAENAKAREQEEKLQAEERRIKEELKKLREDQEQLQRSRIEEEKAKRERMIRQQQIQREKLIEDQQRQIRALKQFQGDLVTASSSVGSSKKQEVSVSPHKMQQSNSGRAVDPRLARHLKIADRQSESMDVDSVAKSKPSSVASNPIVASKHLEKSPQNPLQSKHLEKSPQKPLQSKHLEKSPQKPLQSKPLVSRKIDNTSTASSVLTAPPTLPSTSQAPAPKVFATAPAIPTSIQKILAAAPIISGATSNSLAAASSQQHVVSQERLQTNRSQLQPPDTAPKVQHDVDVQSQPTASKDSSKAAALVKPEEIASARPNHNKDNTLKRVASQEPVLRTKEHKADGQYSKTKDTIDEPPAKKRKAEKLVKENIERYDIAKRVIEQYSEEPKIDEVGETNSTEIEKMDVDEQQQDETQESPQRIKFKRASHSEWRKHMIEKAKVERKQMIPKETELPRQMRMDNHEALLVELGKRLESGEITKDAHDALVKQINLMYAVQRSRDSIDERRKLSDERRMKPSAPHRKSRSPEPRAKPYEKSGELARLPEGKAQRQKETNEDLIRQLRKKRLDAEKEQLKGEERQEKYRSRIDNKRDEHRFPRRGRDERYRILERRDDPRKRDRESANRDSRRDPIKDRAYATKDRPLDSKEREIDPLGSKEGQSNQPLDPRSVDSRERLIDRSVASKDRQRGRSDSNEKQGSRSADSKERQNDQSIESREQIIDRSIAAKDRQRDRSDSKENQGIGSADSKERPIDRSVASKDRQRDRSDSKEKQSSRSADSRERQSDGSADSRERPIDRSVASKDRQRDRSDSKEKQGIRSADSKERQSDGSADSRERPIDRSVASKDRQRDRSDSKEKQGIRSADSKERQSDGSADSRGRLIDRSVASKDRQRDRSDSKEKQGTRSADSKERQSDGSADSKEGGRSVDYRERHHDRRRNPALDRVTDKKRSSKEKSPDSINRRQRERDGRSEQRQRSRDHSPVNRKHETSKEKAPEGKGDVHKGESRLRRDSPGRKTGTEGKAAGTPAADARKEGNSEELIANTATKSKERSSENEPSNDKFSNKEVGTTELPRSPSKVAKNQRKATQKESVADKCSNVTVKPPKKGVLHKNNDKGVVVSSDSKTGAPQREPKMPKDDQSTAPKPGNQSNKGRSEILPGFRIPRKEPSQEDKEKPASANDPDPEIRNLSWRHAEGLPFPGPMLRARGPGPSQRGFRPRLGPPGARMPRGPHPPHHRMPPPRFHGEFRDGTPPSEGVRHDPEQGNEEPQGPPVNYRRDGWGKGGPIPRQMGPRFHHGPRPPFRHFELEPFAEDQGPYNEEEFYNDGDQEFYIEEGQHFEEDNEYYEEEQFLENDEPMHDHPMPYFDEESEQPPDYNEDEMQRNSDGPPQFGPPHGPPRGPPRFRGPMRHPEERRPRFRNPEEMGHRFRNPEEMRQRFRNPEEVRQRFRNPEEVRQRFRPPEEMEQRFKNPEEMGQRFRNPEEMGQRFRNPAEMGPRFRHPAGRGPRFRGPMMNEPRFGPPDARHRDYERHDIEQLGFQEPPFMEEENVDSGPPNREPPHIESRQMEHQGYYEDGPFFHDPEKETPFLHENREGFPGGDEYPREHFEQNMHPPQFEESGQQFGQEFPRQRPYFPPEEEFHGGPHEFRQHEDFARPPPNREFDMGPPFRQSPPFSERMPAFPPEDHGQRQEFMERPPHGFSNPGPDTNMYQNIQERRLSPRPYAPSFYPVEGQSNVGPVTSAQQQGERPLWMSGPQEQMQGKPVMNTANPVTVNPIMQMIQSIRQNAEPAQEPAENNTAPASKPSSFIGVRELFQKLVSTGLIDSAGSNAPVEKSSTPPPTLVTEEESIPEVGFVIEDLKRRHTGVINMLYSGAKCASCGLRFRQEDKRYYRDHLDWHFRNNRKEKESKRSVSRSWFYFIEQWMDMDDVTDLEEQAKSSVFESEAKAQEPVGQVVEESCAVLGGDQDSVCKICYDPFEQFWDETLEEWRYKDARRVDGKTYHINCYSDVESGDLPSSSDEEMKSGDEQIHPFSSPTSYLDRTYNMFDTDAPLIKQEQFASGNPFKSELKTPEDTEMNRKSENQFPPAISQLFNLSNVKQEPVDTEMTPEQGLPFLPEQGLPFLQTVKKEPEETPADSLIKPEPESLKVSCTDSVDASIGTQEVGGSNVAEVGIKEPSASNSEHMPVTVIVEPDQRESEVLGHQKTNTNSSANVRDEVSKDTVLTPESTDESSLNEQLEKRPNDIQIGFDPSSKLNVQFVSDQSSKVSDNDKTVDNPNSKMSDEVEIGSDASSAVSAEVQIDSDSSSKVCGEILSGSGASSNVPGDIHIVSTDPIAKVSDKVEIGSDPSVYVSEANQIVADPSSKMSHELQTGSDKNSKLSEEIQIDSSSKVEEEGQIVAVLGAKVTEEDQSGSGSIPKVSDDVEIGSDSISKVAEKDSESTSSSHSPVVSDESLSKGDENCQSDALDMSAINSDEMKIDANPQS